MEQALQSGHGMEEEAQEGGLPEEVLAQINERKAELNAMRKDRRKNKELIGRFASQEVFLYLNICIEIISFKDDCWL